jgi:hypothetical protein
MPGRKQRDGGEGGTARDRYFQIHHDIPLSGSTAGPESFDFLG